MLVRITYVVFSSHCISVVRFLHEYNVVKSGFRFFAEKGLLCRTGAALLSFLVKTKAQHAIFFPFVVWQAQSASGLKMIAFEIKVVDHEMIVFLMFRAFRLANALCIPPWLQHARFRRMTLRFG